MPGHAADFERHLRVERRRGELTIACYLGIVGEFARHLAANAETAGMHLTEASRLHCIGYLGSPTRAAAAEPSRSVWNIRLAALRSFFQYLVDQEIIVRNPTHRIEHHKIASKEPIPLSLSEYLDLVDAAGRSGPLYRSRNVAIVHVFFHTALRVRELVSLDVDQIDWDAYALRDVRTKGAKWLSPKFPDLVAASLQEYLAERGRRSPVTSGALFLSKRGTRISVRGVEKLVRDLGRAAGIARPVTPHLLRHSCVTELVTRGTSLKVVQEICNHATQATTERYVHARAGADRAAIDALGEAVSLALYERRKRMQPRAA